MANANLLKYVPFQSFVDPSFWHKLSELKIDVDRLDDGRKNINGFYTNSNVLHCLMEIDCTSFNQEFEEQICKFKSIGAIYNKNKIEDFKSCDKAALIHEEGKLLWDDITSGRCLENPNLLSRFFILAFADLKCYKYYYWFAYPCPSEPLIEKINEPKSIMEIIPVNQLNELKTIYFQLNNTDKTFFIIKAEQNGTLQHFKLINKMSAADKLANFLNESIAEYYFCFSDPCSKPGNAGWPLRLFLIMLTHLCPSLRNKEINVLSIRSQKAVSIENSLHFTVKIPSEDINIDNVKWIGWEPNDQGKYLPKCVSMAASMDPQKLAESGVMLNLKLMKWRLLPDLDLNKNSSVKCLLFGAGTLGCSVARSLIAWGVRNLTFIDSGHVSFSNPVRQSLFLHEDAVNFKEKSKACAERLHQICPGINVEGYNLHIPMPGFPVGESLKTKTAEAIKKIEELVEKCDAIFMLTDSRESRWLPTLLGAVHNKIVINAALGFDSYLVMRHGSNPESASSESSTPSTVEGLKCIDGNRLGCYFCNDITAPGDSMSDRTLDQQCTVTRPAVSNIAGSLAVELLISLIQNPKKANCPAYISLHNNDVNALTRNIPEGLLGIIPHSIRGNISCIEQIIPATERFHQCIACSKAVLDEYRKNGHSFLFKVFETSKYLEDLTGISALMSEEHAEIFEYDSASDLETSE